MTRGGLLGEIAETITRQNDPPLEEAAGHLLGERAAVLPSTTFRIRFKELAARGGFQLEFTLPTGVATFERLRSLNGEWRTSQGSDPVYVYEGSGTAYWCRSLDGPARHR